ncbi:TIR domain-containing protein [Verminephrobacter aporrectodeae subsp. tuberculatae]|uniref:toll/interleukin-1 receptor domain-containing protein n=1 Tax=Verminephrobacter aporrectodeae TaxID=1110389 RepID=UPI002237F34A|nr:toll/interleukin-1 receptor domain-containing protein [Verminephrobacter aporrectodeae]MCW5219844.1 TIR domain-containing protein [Verminephrobacter aporrectodeae subsp. tuberculatae]MCW5289132.1 TIR domain-containing protein [Verminephrobacter aporrectodeae subsp. tuberculatae]
MPKNNVPKVFISYSHDSQDHKKWVLDLATRLCNNGIDAILDQWELGPGQDLLQFMNKHLRAANRILMICTENYVKKANDGTGGVGYENMIITGQLFNNTDSNKFIPLIRQIGTSTVPSFLQSKIRLDFSDSQFEFSFDELIRSILGAPLYKKPAISNNPFSPVSNTPVEKTGDGLLKLMKIIVEQFELQSYSSGGIVPSTLRARMNISRTLFETLLDQAEEQELIGRSYSLNKSESLYLTRKGRAYAIQHQLVPSE